MDEALAKKLDEIIQTVQKLNNDNALHSSECLYIVGLIIIGLCVGGFIWCQCHHDNTQREINRQNALVQMYKTTIEETAVKNMSKIEIEEILSTVTKCLNEKTNTTNEQGCTVGQNGEENDLN